MEKDEIAAKILKTLDKAYPDAPATYLNFDNHFELLIATILSARATDVGVNKVTPILFSKYPTPEKLGVAELEKVAEIIRPLGAFNRKSVYIVDTARMVTEEFNGQIPKTLDELITFKGVSRKTANVILSVAFNLTEGVVVDTHVGRVSVRLGLSEHEKKPDKIERDLMELLPIEMWNDYARLMGAHGRRTCKSQRPKCPDCSVNTLCPSAEI
ncbi:MAG: endonuclease III [Candidatus Thorarchaeota archaeon]|jgi:endonuclease-3